MSVDRFHYKSHKCCSFFDPDSYHGLDTQRSTTAESINARIKRAMHHMRYLGSDNLIPFLQIRFALLNIAALYQQRYDVSDMEDENLTSFLCEIVSCDCACCQVIRTPDEDENGGEIRETERVNGAGTQGSSGREMHESSMDGAEHDTTASGEREIQCNNRSDRETEEGGGEPGEIQCNNGNERETEEEDGDLGNNEGETEEGEPGTGNNKNRWNVGSISYVAIRPRGGFAELPS